MPWKENSSYADQMRRRIAWFIKMRCKLIGVGVVAERSGVTRQTLRKYFDCDFPTGDSASGPKDVEKLFAILTECCRGYNETPMKVLYAAEMSVDTTTFQKFLSYDYVAHIDIAPTQPALQSLMVGAPVLHRPPASIQLPAAHITANDLGHVEGRRKI